MAKIIATVDTETDMVTATVNGVEIPNVTDVDIHSYLTYDGEITCSVCIGTTMKDDGVVTRTYISKAGVSESPPGKEIDKTLAKIMADIRKSRKC